MGKIARQRNWYHFDHAGNLDDHHQNSNLSIFWNLSFRLQWPRETYTSFSLQV